MGVTAKAIIPAKQAESVLTTQYTAENCKTVIDKMTATNTSTSNATITVNLVTGGGVAYAVTKSRSIAPGEAYTFPEIVGHVIEDGGYISTIASASSALTLRASGREIT